MSCEEKRVRIYVSTGWMTLLHSNLLWRYQSRLLSPTVRDFLVWWLFHHTSSSPLYGNLQAITLFYFKNPLFNQLELWQRSIGITVLCIILQFTHIHFLWQYQMFQHTLVHTLSWSCRHCASQPHPRHGKSCLYKATTKETRTT